MLCVQRWSDAGPTGRVPGSGVGKYMQCREPKTGQLKVELYYEDDPLCPSGYIIYLCLCWSPAPVPSCCAPAPSCLGPEPSCHFAASGSEATTGDQLLPAEIVDGLKRLM